jgi:hypothetical protein
MASETRTTYRELDLILIPEDIPELGIEAGTRGTVEKVYDDRRGGQGLYVEVSREDGTTVGFVQLETPGPTGGDDWRVMAYSSFD